tara:strand:+ start:130 stop:606 length:477 start_codon:yes stop_codon:yes gene_type:complete
MKIDFVAEVPKGTKLKYELDDGVMRLDRVINTPLTYPETYGYITNTLAGDGDPLDALLLGNHDILPGTHVYARPVGVLDMKDEHGQDEKILLVPDNSVDKTYASISELEDLDSASILLIRIFFENYKNNEKDKWSVVNGILGREEAEKLIQRSLVSRM